MQPRRQDPAFGSEPEHLDAIDALVAYEDAGDPQPEDKLVGKPLPKPGKHRRQVSRGQLFGRIRARMYRR